MIRELTDDWRKEMERLTRSNLNTHDAEKKKRYIKLLLEKFPKEIGEKYRFFKMISYKANSTIIDFILYGYLPKKYKITANNAFNIIASPCLRCVEFQDDNSKNKSYKDVSPLLFDFLSDRTEYVDIDAPTFLNEYMLLTPKKGMSDDDKKIMEEFEKEITTFIAEKAVKVKKEKKQYKIEDDFRKINSKVVFNKTPDEFDLPDNFFNDFKIDFNDEWKKIFED